ncbi:interleukin-20 receptor subunit alpha isoform X3 [Oncorhynchus kisutch]|uniref:interleukin-20 receptor subunit alpha isoform X3 n=1 Tax=Oncorhynchus kisutch TaxID=8019 RepID=UPI0012DC7B2A|nr:interleukin-20 receptor subunit alpha isoform X3 [Oncorhynchus kisutch]
MPLAVDHLLSAVSPFLVVSHGSSVGCPEGVHFNSVNLRNIAKWHPGKDTPNDTHYTVEYAIYGDRMDSGATQVRWRVKNQCRDIPQTRCDLSNETTDLDEGYFARVKAVGTNLSSKWAFTEKRFDPKADTTFGPPLVKLVVKENSVTVKLKGPMRWKTGNMTKEYSLLKIYPQMTYNLSVYDNRSNKTVLSLPIPWHASEWQCLTTPKDPFYDQLLLMLMGAVVPSVICLFMLILAGCLFYHFVCGNKQKSPPFLEILDLQNPPQTFCPEHTVTVNVVLVNIAKPMELITIKPNNIPALIHQTEWELELPNTSQQAPGIEPPKEGTCEDEFGEAQPEPLDYGFVGAAPEMPEVRESEASDIEKTHPLRLSQVNPYIAQRCAPGSQEPVENVLTGMCLDMNPKTGHFRMPLLSDIKLGVESTSYKEPDQMGPYAPQHVSVRETTEVDLWGDEAEEPQSYPTDYGFVGAVPKQQMVPTKYQTRSNRRDNQPLLLAQVNLYRSQRQALFPQESEEEDGLGGGNCVDWSPTTGILQMPLLSKPIPEVEGARKDRESEQLEILPSVLVRQSSEESEGESDLTKLQNVWSLQINMED